MNAHQTTPTGLPRARSIGIPFGGDPGPSNAITDVSGVQVGYVTLIEGDGPLRAGQGPVRTGVTAILARGRDGWGTGCAAGFHSFNGNGELTASHWLAETGILSSAVLLTNTYAVGTVHRGVVDWINQNRPGQLPWEFPVVGETYDGYLNDVSGAHVRTGDAVTAIDQAHGGPIEEGSVGGGTGMCGYGYKGGSGTASRLVALGTQTCTVGVFVQANFGRRRHLTIAGRPVGQHLLDDNPLEETNWFLPAGAGSIIAVVATDAPLLPGQASALARRATLGIGRTGTTGSHSSGDIFLAFSTANPGQLGSEEGPDSPQPGQLRRLEFLGWDDIDGLFEATVQAVEEAVLNALVANSEMTGRDGHRMPALPRDRVTALLG
ncbi:MAG: P1 family peptidase [Actinobacteria bacterium]|nr:P1 family peptidase [Actinomycetota bacterium]